MHAAAAGWSATGGAAGHMHVCMDGWLLQLQAPTWHERLGGHQQGGHEEQSLQWGKGGRGGAGAGSEVSCLHKAVHKHASRQ